MSFVRTPTVAITATLAGICALLLIALALLTTGSFARVDSPDLVRPTLSAPDLPAVTLVSDRSRTSAELPMFHPDRKPIAKPAVPGALSNAADLTEAPFQLKGVLIANGMARASLLRNIEGDIQWVSRGNEIDGWTLESVQPDRVELSREKYRTTLLLYPER